MKTFSNFTKYIRRLVIARRMAQRERERAAQIARECAKLVQFARDRDMSRQDLHEHLKAVLEHELGRTFTDNRLIFTGNRYYRAPLYFDVGENWR